MSYIEVRGPRQLRGEIRIQGSKNAVLPVMAASLLHQGTVVIDHVPIIQDVQCMMGIFQFLGCRVELNGHRMVLDSSGLNKSTVPDQAGGEMRSSILLLAPLLVRTGEARLKAPGGCRIGARPVDLHLSALKQMGAEITETEDLEGIQGRAGRLKGCSIVLRYPSVGATETVLIAAAAAEGVTCLYGAAREPEIVTLCKFLCSLGAVIAGIGTDCLVIQGKKEFRDAEIIVPGDRIVAGTYMGAVLSAGGAVFLRGALPEENRAVLEKAEQMGAGIRTAEEGIHIQRTGSLKPVFAVTGPYPEFPTDLQSVFLAAAAGADGSSEIEETVFEARFAVVKELQKMGAHIIIKDRKVQIEGVRQMSGSRLLAKDLRGGAALVAAALAAQGVSEISGYGYIRRGYEDICRDLSAVGGRIALKG